jgi:hypothetical protein
VHVSVARRDPDERRIASRVVVDLVGGIDWKRLPTLEIGIDTGLAGTMVRGRPLVAGHPCERPDLFDERPGRRVALLRSPEVLQWVDIHDGARMVAKL